jgi:serine/threonine protein kinase
VLLLVCVLQKDELACFCDHLVVHSLGVSVALCCCRYDTSADIWSFGITLIELAHGKVPLARMNPMRVIMSTLNNPAPELQDNAITGRTYSKVGIGSIPSLTGSP